jgi:hypothetical protein
MQEFHINTEWLLLANREEEPKPKMLCCPIVGIYFYQLVNGEYYELKAGAALQILEAAKLERPELPKDEGRNWRDWITRLASRVL